MLKGCLEITRQKHFDISEIQSFLEMNHIKHFCILLSNIIIFHMCALFSDVVLVVVIAHKILVMLSEETTKSSVFNDHGHQGQNVQASKIGVVSAD